jgi:DNA-binding beta-propeller fold protein YncE
MPVVLRAAVLALSIVFVTRVESPAPPPVQQAARPSKSTPAAAPLPAWPPAPAQARIRFLRALDPASGRRKPSLFKRFVRFIVGANDEPQMLQPYGIAVAPDGKVYVADTFGKTIHVYDVARSDYSTIAVDGKSLIGVAVVRGLLFVTDSVSGRLLCLDAKGHVLWTRGHDSGFLRPTGLVAATDRLYVVDTILNKVVIVSLTGQIMGTFGDRGDAPGQFNFPTNIARATDGRLFVTDTMNFRVQVFDSEGKYLNSFGHAGDGAGDFAKPKGIAIDSAGHVYVVEGFNDVVQIFDDSGRLLLAFGGSGAGAGQLWLPTGIAIANDRIYVADSANRRLQMFEYVRTEP